MKLKTNLFQGKKPSLEEGQMICNVNDEETATNVTERSKGCKLCLKFMKVIFYILLALFLLFLVWIAFMFVSQTLSFGESRVMCGVVYDYTDQDNGFNDFNLTEVDDMTMNLDGTDTIGKYTIDIIKSESSTDIYDDGTADVKSVTYEEAKDYMRRAMQRQIELADD